MARVSCARSESVESRARRARSSSRGSNDVTVATSSGMEITFPGTTHDAPTGSDLPAGPCAGHHRPCDGAAVSVAYLARRRAAGTGTSVQHGVHRPVPGPAELPDARVAVGPG